MEPDAPTNGQTVPKDAVPDFKYRKALVTRIVKAVKSPFEDALRKEGELRQKPFEKELANLDRLLENSLLSRRDSIGTSQFEGGAIEPIQPRLLIRGGTSKARQLYSDMDDNPTNERNPNLADSSHEEGPTKRERPTPESIPTSNGFPGGPNKANGLGSVSSRFNDEHHVSEPLTPPTSSGDDSQPLARGGIPWYMEPFDPLGTTLQEERWTGRELVRGMSEELSDMDEDELSELVVANEAGNAPESADAVAADLEAKAKAKKRKIANARRRRPWG